MNVAIGAPPRSSRHSFPFHPVYPSLPRLQFPTALSSLFRRLLDSRLSFARSFPLFSTFSSLFFANKGVYSLLNLNFRKTRKDPPHEDRSPNAALAPERCLYRTPTGRQCASRTLDPESSYCVRHSVRQPFASQPPAIQPSDSLDFAALLTENACDFQDPQGINHSLAALYTPAVPPPANTTTEPASETLREPVNQPVEKKRYQVRVHTNMHVTGSEPQ